MTKLQEKLIQARNTGNLYFNQLMDVRDASKKLLKATLSAYGVKDVEDIKETDLRASAGELEAMSDKIAELAEQFNGLLDKVYDIDLSKF